MPSLPSCIRDPRKRTIIRDTNDRRISSGDLGAAITSKRAERSKKRSGSGEARSTNSKPVKCFIVLHCRLGEAPAPAAKNMQGVWVRLSCICRVRWHPGVGVESVAEYACGWRDKSRDGNALVNLLLLFSVPRASVEGAEPRNCVSGMVLHQAKGLGAATGMCRIL